MPNDSTEKFKVWRPIEGIPPGFLTAKVECEDGRTVSVKLIQGYDRHEESNGPTLVLTFSDVLGLMVHDELHHPGLHEKTPKANGRTFPCLIKHKSGWLDRLTQIIPEQHAPVHYQLITGFPVVDVLCNGKVEAHWEKQAADVHSKQKIDEGAKQAIRTEP